MSSAACPGRNARRRGTRVGEHVMTTVRRRCPWRRVGLVAAVHLGDVVHGGDRGPARGPMMSRRRCRPSLPPGRRRSTGRAREIHAVASAAAGAKPIAGDERQTADQQQHRGEPHPQRRQDRLHRAGVGGVILGRSPSAVTSSAATSSAEIASAGAASVTSGLAGSTASVNSWPPPARWVRRACGVSVVASGHGAHCAGWAGANRGVAKRRAAQPTRTTTPGYASGAPPVAPGMGRREHGRLQGHRPGGRA